MRLGTLRPNHFEAEAFRRRFRARAMAARWRLLSERGHERSAAHAAARMIRAFNGTTKPPRNPLCLAHS